MNTRSSNVVPLSDSALLPVQGTAWRLMQAKSAAGAGANGFAAFIKALEAQMVIRYQLGEARLQACVCVCVCVNEN